ncbi:MAG: N-acetylglucosamine-6-phosphate deacetylase [Dehalococcoidia bacterium]
MQVKTFVNARIVFETRIHEGCVVVRDGVIGGVHIGACPIPHDAEVIDCGGRYLAPGLIDVHVHGGGGHSLMTDDPDEVRAYARWAARRGVTGFLVSTSGRDHAEIVRRLEALAPVVGCEPGAARVLGFHLEGPYINPARKGAFPPQWLRAPDVNEYWELVAASDKQVRQVTLAPELPGGDALIEAVLASGAVAAIGHTDASYDEAMHAFELGCTHVTHCFNAMRPFSHRDPGCLAAIMASDGVTAELIGDGAHVDYAAASVLLRAKGAQGIVLVTDGMTLAGTGDGEAQWEGQAIRVEGGKAVRVADSTIIGGVITLDQTVRNAVQHLGVPLQTAVAMAATHAARAMRLDMRYGAVEPGLAADFVLLDDALSVQDTYVGGQLVGG